MGGHIHAFEKPWFTTFLSLVACWISLLLYELANKLQSCCLPSHTKPKPELKQPLLQVLPLLAFELHVLLVCAAWSAQEGPAALEQGAISEMGMHHDPL